MAMYLSLSDSLLDKIPILTSVSRCMEKKVRVPTETESLELYVRITEEMLMYGREATTKTYKDSRSRYSEQEGMIEKFTAVCYNETII